MQIKITKASNDNAWYKDSIGQVFKVIPTPKFMGWCSPRSRDICVNHPKNTPHTVHTVSPDDCEFVDIP